MHAGDEQPVAKGFQEYARERGLVMLQQDCVGHAVALQYHMLEVNLCAWIGGADGGNHCTTNGVSRIATSAGRSSVVPHYCSVPTTATDVVVIHGSALSDYGSGLCWGKHFALCAIHDVCNLHAEARLVL